MVTKRQLTIIRAKSGKKGGAAGIGAVKVRTKEQCQRAAAISVAVRRANKAKRAANE